MKIGNLEVTKNGRPYFIADIAANHDGSLERAFKLIELAKIAGADVAKFQNFKAQYIVSKGGFEALPKQTHQASWEKSVYDVYEEAAINNEWTKKLKDKCDEIGIEYMTSPYDFDSIDKVAPYVNAFKIGSGDITWLEIIEYMAKMGKPILLATGASKMQEVEMAIKTIEKYNNKVILMQCNTNYTASNENYKYINLYVLNTYAKKYPNYVLGLSDHTYGDATVVGAVALGARVIEKHFTDDNNRVGPDHKFAMNPDTWKNMVNNAMNVWSALGDGIKKVEYNEQESRRVQQRSIFMANNVKAGQVIKRENLIPLRPIAEDGISPCNITKVVGRKAKKNLFEDTYLKWEDIE